MSVHKFTEVFRWLRQCVVAIGSRYAVCFFLAHKLADSHA